MNRKILVNVSGHSPEQADELQLEIDLQNDQLDVIEFLGGKFRSKKHFVSEELGSIVLIEDKSVRISDPEAESIIVKLAELISEGTACQMVRDLVAHALLAGTGSSKIGSNYKLRFSQTWKGPRPNTSASVSRFEAIKTLVDSKGLTLAKAMEVVADTLEMEVDAVKKDYDRTKKRNPDLSGKRDR